VTELERLAAADPRVVLTGYVYGDDLAALYAHAGAFVLPSLLEGLPLTLLEAGSHGVPLVASDIPPHREVLQPGGPGRRLFPVGDEAALADAIAAALREPEAERAAASVSREDVLNRYSWEAAVEQTERLYESVARR
jgi:glycosyltransferase involved in cell wall biosynthesis